MQDSLIYFRVYLEVNVYKNQTCFIRLSVRFSDVRNSYESWKGSLKCKKCYRTLQNMNKLFNELFIDEWRLKYEQGRQE